MKDEVGILWDEPKNWLKLAHLLITQSLIS